MDGYIEAWVMVDGADDGSINLNSEDEFNKWLQREQFDAENMIAQGHVKVVQVFRIDHGHPEDVEDCGCVQYLTDHHPYVTFEAKS